MLHRVMVTGCALLLWAPNSSAANQRRDVRRAPSIFLPADLQRGERPDDPPGLPALARRPRPFFEPGTEIQRGRFLSIQVNVDSNGVNIVGDAANEPSIAVDPTDPRRMAIGWRQFDTIASNFREAGYAYTSSGGTTWTAGEIESGIFRSDPVLDFDRDGNFYYNSLTLNGNDFDCWVFTSVDGGATWDSGTFAFGGDKAWMAIDRTGGLGSGNVYCAWSVFAGCCGNDTFNRSFDMAQSFSTPSAILTPPIFGTLDVAENGALYVGGIDPGNFGTYRVAVSTNVSNPLGTPTFTTTTVPMGGGMAFQTGPNPAGLLGQAVVKVNPTNGHVYLLASVDPPGPDPLDIHFCRSTNGGSTWEPFVRVNDDASGNWQWFGTMDVAPNGRIDAVWNDSRAGGGASNLSELHYSYSIDGGLTWSPNLAVSPMWNSLVGFPNQNKIGDYYDLVSLLGEAHLAWAATFNGEQDVYYLRLQPVP